MRRTLLCALGLLLLITLAHCRHAAAKTRADLSASPSWLSPGASVTLNCSVNGSTTGWRFFWYKAVPKLSNSSYSYELLPGSESGTEEHFYKVHGQTHTAGYVCRAGRGDPEYHTFYSKPKFVWSGDFHTNSVKVVPDREQHFFSESVSLSCEGNSDQWRVMRFTKNGGLYNCSEWGTVRGSTCEIQKHTINAAVYWCESRSGQFSNAVNLTGQNGDVILVSPVRPVSEGASVTLSCELKTETLDSDVRFYRNGRLIQNDTTGRLSIPAMSRSDEGFYKCKRSGRESRPSWVAMKPASRPHSSSHLLPSMICLLCGVFLITLLLLICCYRKSHESCLAVRTILCQGTNQGSASDRVVDQNESEPTVDPSLGENGDGDVIYSLVELKNVGKKGKSSPQVMNESVYSEVKLGAVAGP